MESYRVVFDPDSFQFEVEDGGIADSFQVGPVAIEVSEEAFDLGPVGGVWGQPRCWKTAMSARNSRVSPEVICGPRSDQATRMGRRGSSRARSTRSGVSSSRSPWCSRAEAKATFDLGVGELGCRQEVDPIPGYDVDDGDTVAAGTAEPGPVPDPDLVRFPRDGSGHGREGGADRLRTGSGSVTWCFAAIRRTVEAATHTLPTYEPRWASLRWERSTGPHLFDQIQDGLLF